MKAIGYVRVSSAGQADEGYSLDAQRDMIRKCCDDQGWELVAIHADEGVSGGKGLDKRQGLVAAIDSVKSGYKLVVVKRDRLARDYVLAGYCDLLVRKKGASIYAIENDGANGDSPQERLMRGIIDLFADFERAMGAARTSAVLQHKRSKREQYTRVPPYGWRYENGKMVEHPKESEAVWLAVDLRESGMGYRKIAEELFRQGHTSRQGKMLAHMTVKAILERQKFE